MRICWCATEIKYMNIFPFWLFNIEDESTTILQDIRNYNLNDSI